MPVQPTTRIFIGGLKRTVEKDELLSEFGQFGKILDVWIAYDPAGFAFVEYSTVEEATNALNAKHKTECFGTEVRVEFTERRSAREDDDSKPRLFIGNIKDPVEKENIRSVFEEFGDVTDVWIAHNPPGFAFVEYNTMEEATRAVEACNGKERFGGPLKVQITKGRKEGRRNRTFRERRGAWANRHLRGRFPSHGNTRHEPYARGYNARGNSYYEDGYGYSGPYRGGRGGYYKGQYDGYHGYTADDHGYGADQGYYGEGGYYGGEGYYQGGYNQGGYDQGGYGYDQTGYDTYGYGDPMAYGGAGDGSESYGVPPAGGQPPQPMLPPGTVQPKPESSL